MINSIIEAGVNATKHAVLRTISVICVILVCAGLYWAVYRTFIKPRPTESYAQQAEQITNNETNYYPNKKVFGLGLTLWGWDLGITRYDYPKKKELPSK